MKGSKQKYTQKQKDKAAHIEKSYEQKGASPKKAEAIAWATVNKQSGGGEASGSGRNTTSTQKAAARTDSSKRAAATRRSSAKPESYEHLTKQELLVKARLKNISGRSTMTKEDLILALRKPS